MPQGRRARVLVADDDADTRELYAYVLRAQGYDVKEVGDGIAATKEISQNPPDLVIADIRMPRADGFEVSRICKAHEPNPIPVIIVTAWSTGDTVSRAEEAGADAVLLKPVDPQDVVAAVQRLLGSKT